MRKRISEDERRDSALQMHRMIAPLLETHPELISDAAGLVAGAAQPAIVRWRDLLQRPPAEIAATISADTPDADELRKHSPLIPVAVGRGLLSLQRPRNEISLSRTKAESKLARLRLDRGLRQEEMAARAGIPLSTYRRLERLKLANPPVGYLAACARVLGVELAAVVEQRWLDWPERNTGS